MTLLKRLFSSSPSTRGKKLSLIRQQKAHHRSVERICFAPSGSLLATAANASRDTIEIKLWDSESGTQTQQFNPPHKVRYGITDLAFLPDGKTLLSADDTGTILFWDTLSGTCLSTIQNAHEGNCRLAVSKDGIILLTGGWDRKLKFWDVTTRAPLEQLSCADSVNSIKVFADGRLIATKIFNRLAVWDADRRKLLFTHFLGVDCQTPRPLLEVTQDEPVLIIGHSMEPDSEIAAATLDVLTSTKMLETVRCAYRTSLNGTILGMVLSFDGKFLLCVGYGSHGQQVPKSRHAFLALLDAHKGVVRDVKDEGKEWGGDSDYPLCVASSPTELSFACGLQCGEYGIWTVN